MHVMYNKIDLSVAGVVVKTYMFVVASAVDEYFELRS